MRCLVIGAALLALASQAALAAPTGNCSQTTSTTARFCNDSQTTTVSGTVLTIPSNGGLVPSFELIIAGAPTSVSIVIAGCMPSGTCETLDTYTTVANAIRAPALSKTYTSFRVTPTWAGGTGVSVTVNTMISSSRLSGGGAGGTLIGTISLTNQNSTINPVILPTAATAGMYEVISTIRSTGSGAGGTVTQFIYANSAVYFGSACSGSVNLTNPNSSISCVGAMYLNAGEGIYITATYSGGTTPFRIDAICVKLM